jgi:hypothetical protein
VLLSADIDGFKKKTVQKECSNTVYNVNDISKKNEDDIVEPQGWLHP